MRLPSEVREGFARRFSGDDGGIVGQSFRFVVAGGIASSINWVTRLGASFFISFPLALATGAVVGMAIGFVLYRSWVFPHSARSLRVQTALFLAVNAVTACFVIGTSLLIASMLVDLPTSVRVQESIAHAMAIGFGAVISFAGHRTFTFAHRGVSR